MFGIGRLFLVAISCPDCGQVMAWTTPIPPKQFIDQRIGEIVSCGHCKREYPRSWLLVNGFVTIEEQAS